MGSAILLGFLSVADTAPSSGDSFVLVLKYYHSATDFLVGGSNPGSVNIPPPQPPPQRVGRAGLERPP